MFKTQIGVWPVCDKCKKESGFTIMAKAEILSNGLVRVDKKSLDLGVLASRGWRLVNTRFYMTRLLCGDCE